MSNGGHYQRKTLERQKPGYPARVRILERGLAKLQRKWKRQSEQRRRWF